MTGAGGFLGKALSEALAAEYAVVGLEREAASPCSAISGPANSREFLEGWVMAKWIFEPGDGAAEFAVRHMILKTAVDRLPLWRIPHER
jgi:nucleoside-diphosphate-sugar epimerase